MHYSHLICIFSFISGLPQPIAPKQIDVELIKKIQSLKDRLRDAEFQNSARSQELISLKAQLTALEAEKNRRTSDKSTTNGFKNSSRIFFEGQNVLRLPSIYNFMPHLMDSPNSLKPALHISKDRQGGELYIIHPISSHGRKDINFNIY